MAYAELKAKHNDKTTELHTGSLFTPITPIKNLCGTAGGAQNPISISMFNNQKRMGNREADPKLRKENQENRPHYPRKDSSGAEVILSEQCAGRSASSTKNNTSNNPHKSKNQHQWPGQTSQFLGAQPQVNSLMLPWYGQAAQGLSLRAEAPSSHNKMSHHDQSTKVNEKASEFKSQSKQVGFFSANSNTIGASIMKDRRKLDLSVSQLDSSDQSNKQEQDRRANHANAAKMMSTPKTKNVNGFDPRPFHIANGGGLTGFGTGNAPNSNIKAELKVPVASYDHRKMLFSAGYGSEAKEFMRSCDSKKSMTMGQKFLHFDQSSNRDDNEVPNQQLNNLPRSIADLCANTNIYDKPLCLTTKQPSFPPRSKLLGQPQLAQMPQFYNNAFFVPSTFVHNQHHNHQQQASMVPHSKTCSRNSQQSKYIRSFIDQQDEISQKEVIIPENRTVEPHTSYQPDENNSSN